MLKIKINNNWLFHLEDAAYKKTGDEKLKDIRTQFGFNKTGAAAGFAARKFENSNWRKLDLPHDYAMELPVDQRCSQICGTRPVTDAVDLFESQYGRADTKTFPIAWYRKSFFVDEEGCITEEHAPVYGNKMREAPKNKRFFIEFEGVFRDYTLWINGAYIDRHLSGYTAAMFDITDQIIFGETNTIAVRLDCSQHEGWFYEGAGIYRDVNLYISENIFCKADDLYVIPETSGNVEIRADIYNMSETAEVRTVSFLINGEEVICEKKELSSGLNSVAFQTRVNEPRLWDIDSPNLYLLEMKLDGKTEQSTRFGFRDIKFDPDKGFFLNGRSLKINGVCLHQDFFGVGIAVTEGIIRYKLEEIQKMGANAMRCVHNPVSKVTLDLCDELGIMVMNETRAFGSSPEALRQLESIAKRDRNHPSIILWSLGNEEFEQNTTLGRRMAKTAKQKLEKLVPNAIPTYAANHGEVYEGVNELFDLRGMNYIRIDVTKPERSIPDYYHQEHPEQAFYCSEEISSLTVRGIYKTDAAKGYVDAYGENTMDWGSTPEGYIKYCMARDYFCGGFMWTGFDYIGEPSPFTTYKRNGKKNITSTFGIVDLCGFPKDPYYYYKAWWTEEPVLHILPHWNFTAGETVRVVAFTNCEKVTLYLNGEKIGEEYLKKYDSPEWSVVFRPGMLKAVGVKDGKELVCERKTADMAGIDIVTHKIGEYTFADIRAIDKDGNAYPCAYNNVNLDITNGEIIATGNGDPTYDGRVNWFAEEASVPLELVPQNELRGEVMAYNDYRRNELYCEYEEKQDKWEDKFRILWKSDRPKEKADHVFKSEFEADESFEYVEFAYASGAVEVTLNGTVIGKSNDGLYRPYRFYGVFQNGINTVEMKVTVNSDTRADIYLPKIGKYVRPKACNPLFSGLMRVIVKPGQDCCIRAETDNGYIAQCRVD